MYRRLYQFFIIILLTMFGMPFLHAQTKMYSTNDTIRQIVKEVTITAPITILSQERWPGSITVLDSVHIEKGSAYQFSEVVNAIPGVYMQQGTMSTNRITIRGIGSRTPYNSNRIKAYWGEVPLTDGDGVTSVEDVSLNEISTMKVIKGAASALYGAGLGGVILLDPWESSKPTHPVRLKSEAGRFSTFSNQVNIHLKPARGDAWIAGSSLHSEGYRENSQYERYTITLKGKQQAGRHYWHYLYNYCYLNGQIPSSLDRIDYMDHPEKAAESWQSIGGYEQANRHVGSVGIVSSIRPQLNHSITLFGQISNGDELRPFNRLDESKKAFGIRDKWTFQSPDVRVEMGGEYRMEYNRVGLLGVKPENRNDLLSKTAIRRWYLNLFGLAEYAIGKHWVLQAAFNLNRTVYRSEGKVPMSEEIHHAYPYVFSPRIGLNYQWSAVSNIYASAGHGFSAPSVEEAQMPDGSFNKDINPEEGVSVELGYRYSARNGHRFADVTIYWMQMHHLLVTKRESEAIFYGINAGRTQHKGIELSFKQRFELSPDQQNVDVQLSYFQSVNQFDDFIDDGEDYSGNHLPGIPAFNASLDVWLNLKPLKVFLNYRQVGDQYLTDDNHKKQEGFGIMGAKISRSFRFGPVNSTFYLGADNLFNTHYAAMVLINAPTFGNNLPRYYYPGKPFNVYGGIQFRF